MSNRCCEPAGGSEQVGSSHPFFSNIVALAMLLSAPSKRIPARAQHILEFKIIIIQFQTYSKNRARTQYHVQLTDTLPIQS